MRLEAIVGAGVLVLVAFLLFSARLFVHIPLEDQAVYFARFTNVGGLTVGADVKISGIKVGIVKSLKVDQDYQATASLAIDKNISLPEDTSAVIATDGLIGNKFVALQVGFDDSILKSGAEITSTKSAVNLEDLIDKFIIGAMSGGR